MNRRVASAYHFLWIAFLLVGNPVVLLSAIAYSDEPYELYNAPVEEVVAKEPGNPVVWVIGISHCSTIIGVYFIQHTGLVQWIPIELATRTETVIYSNLARARRTSITDTCEKPEPEREEYLFYGPPAYSGDSQLSELPFYEREGPSSGPDGDGVR